MKHTFKNSLKKLIPKQKNWNKLVIFSVLAIMVPLSVHTAFLYKQNNAPHDAELRFAEVSNKASIVGSVIPASCLSFPASGIQHYPAGFYVGGTPYPADTSGYCPGTEPVAGVCGNSINGCTAGSGAINSTSDPFAYFWQCKGSNVAGVWGATSPWCVAEKGVCGTTSNTCASGLLTTPTENATSYNWVCAGTNGASSIGCTLPKAVPTVNINFQ